MSCTNSCTNCPKVIIPAVPSCRKSIRDSCRVKPLPTCSLKCDPMPCVRKTKCKLKSSKDSCRAVKPCPPDPCCGNKIPAGCTCITKLTTFNTPYQ